MLLAIVFRKPVVGVLNRFKTLKAPGLTVDTDPAQKVVDSPSPSKLEQLRERMDSPIVQVYEEQLIQSLGISPPTADDAKTLLKVATLAFLQADFERTYYIAWGSQLELLESLNTGGSASTDVGRRYYEMGSARNPPLYMNITFDSWLAFLESSGLIEQSGDTISLTAKGRSFLAHLATNGLSIFKPN